MASASNETPRLLLPYIRQSQAQKEVTHNEGLIILDALVQLNVLDRDLTAPPGSPNDGDLYIPASGASGAWVGRAEQIAQYLQGWRFYQPAEGWLAYVQDEQALLFFDGAAWQVFSGGGGNPPPFNTFLALTDTPSSFSGQALQGLRVNAGETALEFVALGATAFLGLTDTPGSYSGAALQVVRVNATADGLEFTTANPTAFLGLSDTPASYASQALKLVRVNAGETGLEFITSSAGVTDFVDLGDTPANYSGHALKVVRVNAGETALEFTTASPTTFLGLSDTPSSFSSQALKGVRVNSGETALEFAALITTFLGLSDTPSSFSGQGGKLLKVNSGATAVEFETIPYDVGGTVTGTPAATTTLFRYPFPRAVSFPASLTNSRGVCGTAPNAQTDFDLQKGGVSFGTMRFANGATTATFISASGASFAAGDVLTVVSPSALNNLADLGFSLAGSR